MPYDVTTIGSMLGSCECGRDRKFDPRRIAGLLDVANSVGNALNPFSDAFLPYTWARGAAQAIEQRVEDAKKAATPDVVLPGVLDTIGVPTWGYSGSAITAAAAVGVLAVGAFVAYRAVKKSKKGKKR